MAEIPIERRRRSPLAWIVGLLVLAAVGFALWWFMFRDDTDADTAEDTVVSAAVRAQPAASA